MGRTFSHEIGQEIHVILSEIFNARLLRPILFGSDDIVHPPLIAGSGAEHASHEMIMTVRVGEGVQRVMLIHPEVPTGDEDRSGGSERNIALSVPYGAGTHRSRGVIPRAGGHRHMIRQTQLFA